MTEQVKVPTRAVIIAVALVTAAIGVFAGMILSAALVSKANVPLEASADVGFSRDMKDHHAQAVEMSVIVRDGTDDEAVRSLALDVAMTQQQQIGQMHAWLNGWGMSQTSSAPPMQWMDTASGSAHSGGYDAGTPSPASGSRGSMPGMATAADLDRLRQARGRGAERLYLQLMIPHHEAGVQMAQAAVEKATDPQVKRLAETIVKAQASEITLLKELLAARGGPLPNS